MQKSKNKYGLIYSFAKLVRAENLLLIALVLYVSNYYIYKKENIAIPNILLFLLIISTMSIAAGGYVINDYFDLKIDKINKPEAVVLEKIIHRKAGIIWHLFFSAIGLLIGIYMAYYVGHLSFAVIQLGAIFVLFVYSTVLKKIFILGNLTIAILSALLPVLPYLYANALYPPLSVMTVNALLSLSAFAFFTTLIRELIKDIQDIKGDIIGGRKTIPLVWGFLASKIIVFFLMVLLVLFLVPFIMYYYWHQKYEAVWYYVFMLIIPSVILIVLLILYKEPRKFYILSAMMKWIMLTGILFYFLF